MPEYPEGHPLHDVPQAALDAATAAFQHITIYETLPFDADEVESIAHAVLMAGLEALRPAPAAESSASPFLREELRES